MFTSWVYDRIYTSAISLQSVLIFDHDVE